MGDPRSAPYGTAIFMVGGPAGIPYAVSRWEALLPYANSKGPEGGHVHD
ncbi:MAG: hypothetical protein QOJ25_1132 [Solirubrobacteraceae bacterium]|jgi:hypothetical protein|nr:hypothetical protein [Solirubrobacteraceae bacterium]